MRSVWLIAWGRSRPSGPWGDGTTGYLRVGALTPRCYHAPTGTTPIASARLDPMTTPPPLPVTGAWLPGDEPGHRQFFTFAPRPTVCARLRRRALRGRGCLRDLGATRRRRVERHPAVSCVDRRQPCSRALRTGPRRHRAGGTTPSGPGKPIDTDKYFVVCANVLGGCQGSTGPASPHPLDGEPYGSRFPVVTIRDMVRAQAQLGSVPRRRSMAVGDRRLDGWHAGARMGRDVPAPGRLTGRGRDVHAGNGTADRVGSDRTTSDPSRPEVAWRRLLRRRSGRWSRRRTRDRPHGRSGDVPQRQRVHRPLRARTRRQGGGRRHPRDVAALRGRALPRIPRSQAGPPVRHQQLPRDRQGDGSARRRPGARFARTGDAARGRAHDGRRDLERHALSRLSAAADPRARSRRTACRASTSRSTRRTATMRS